MNSCRECGEEVFQEEASLCLSCFIKIDKKRFVPRKRAFRKSDLPFNYDPKDAAIFRKYALTPRDIKDKKKLQDHCCAICGKHESKCTYSRIGKGINTLVIDHDHKSGQVRGLLCPKCNYMLGCAEDNTGVLLRAVDYLKYYRKDTEWHPERTERA